MTLNIFNMIFSFILFLLISSLFMMLNILFFKKMFKNREKNSMFECGFDPMSNMRIPFSIQFFLISLMFLIFDIEISILIPIVYSIKFMNFFLIYSIYLFMLILIFSLYLEFLENMLEWKMN